MTDYAALATAYAAAHAAREQQPDEYQRAAEALLEANEGLIGSAISRLPFSAALLEEDRADLKQEARLALLKAALSYSPARARWSTYAMRSLIWVLTRYWRDTGRTIRLPSHTYGIMQAVRQYATEYRERHGHWPTNRQVAQALQREVDMIVALQRGRVVLSLDTPTGDQDDGTVAELLPDDAASAERIAIEAARAAVIADLLAGLSARQRETLTLRFGFDGGPGMSQRKVAQRMGVKYKDVQRYEADGLRKLSNPRTAQTLRELMDE